MKKRAISFVLCLMMVVTLFGNGIPVYAANELEPPIVATEETSQDAPEESEAEGSPVVEATESTHGEDTNAAGETSSEVVRTSETNEPTEAEPTEATDAEETAEAEEANEVKPSEAADMEESDAVNTLETTEEAVAEEKPDVATPAEAEAAPQPAHGDIVPEARAAGYSIHYEFKPDPHYGIFPESLKNLLPAPQAEVADGTVVTPPDLAATEVKGSSGIWHFQGWDKTTATVDGADVTFTGTWKQTQYKGLHSAYQFSPSTPSKEKGYDKLPQEVIDLLPDALEGLTEGQTITHPTPANTEVEVDGGKWVFEGWPLGNTMVITANTTTYGTWHFIEKANTYTVNYEFKNLPAYRSLPQRVKDLLPAPQADVADGTVVTPPELAVTQVKDLSGIWHFQGWDKTTATVDGADVTFTGTWKLTQYKTFFASYNFVPSIASMDKGHTTLPQEVVDLIPDAMEGLTDGRVITHPTPAKTEVAADGGKWVFAGWPLGNTATVQNGNILTVAEWNFVKGPDQPTMKYTVTFKFASLTKGTDGKPKELPQEVLDLLPAPITDLEAGTNVTYPTLAKTEIPAEGGKWVFTDWPAGTGITITGSALVVGGWRFDKESTPGTTPGTDPIEDKIGNLTVTKTVSGSGGDQNKDFTFTVTLDNTTISGQYGDMTFTGGVATFTLKHGQNKTATGLPTGMSYTVEESDNSGYTVTKTNAAGTIQTGSTATAAFENYKGSSGGSGGSGGSSGGGGGGSSSHTPKPANVTLIATKTLNGAAPSGSSFTFVLNDANGHPLQTKNNQGGTITFDTLTFNKTGAYVYYLTEQTGNDKNVNYDTASYKVTVTVTCPYDYAASVSYEKNGQAYNSVPAFANTTKQAAPAPAQTPPVITPARPLDNVPKTEDNSNLALWGVLAAASLLSLTGLLAGTKTRKDRSQGKEHQS